MLITEKQILQLLQILRDTLDLADGFHSFTYNHEIRLKLFEYITEQQPNEIREI